MIKKKQNEKKEIQQVALDYIEGWYEGNELRMARALHSNMVKRIVESPTADSILHEQGSQSMIEHTGLGGGKNVPETAYKIKVSVLDICENIACVKTESQYIDYLHLAKFEGKWLIINILWDYKADKKLKI